MRGPVDGHVDAAGLEVAGRQDGRQRAAERVWRCVYQSHCADLLPRDPASVGMRSAHGCWCSMGYPDTVLACDNRMAANPLKSLGGDLT